MEYIESVFDEVPHLEPNGDILSGSIITHDKPEYINAFLNTMKVVTTTNSIDLSIVITMGDVTVGQLNGHDIRKITQQCEGPFTIRFTIHQIDSQKWHSLNSA